MGIKQAIEAVDKVEKVERKDGSEYFIYSGGQPSYYSIHNPAPEMAAWIKKALPYLEDYKNGEIATPYTIEFIDALLVEATE